MQEISLKINFHKNAKDHRILVLIFKNSNIYLLIKSNKGV